MGRVNTDGIRIDRQIGKDEGEDIGYGEVDLLDFVETFKRLSKQALGKRAGEPTTGGFARWKVP